MAASSACYWALLSARLEFLYLDPVFARQLDGLADALLGRDLLQFVHPEEHPAAHADLHAVLQSKHSHGSVTRTRFATLARIRCELTPVQLSVPPEDSPRDYIPVDIVINAAADRLVLCFIHALPDTDLAPHPCGAPPLDPPALHALFARLIHAAPRSEHYSRLFQILVNDSRRDLLLSWPPDLPPRDFARLVENAHIGYDPSASYQSTSCTRRYKALNAVPSLHLDVESIFIPYGSVIFACHNLNPPTTSTPAMQHTPYQPRSSYPPSYYDPAASSPASYPLPPLSSSYPTPYTPQHWGPPSTDPPSGSPYHHWPPSSPVHPTSPLPTPSAPYLGPGITRSTSPRYNYPDDDTTTDVVPPARRRVSPGSTRPGEPQHSSSAGGRNSSSRPTGLLKCSSCKATSSPEWRKGPSGKKELCNACGLRYARSRAKKDGHNQSQRRRKDTKGGISKREDSATPPLGSVSVTAHGHSPASSSYSPGSSVRRSYDSATAAAATNTTASSSGGDVYQHHVLDGKITPSPSPPAGTVNAFVHYSPAGAAGVGGGSSRNVSTSGGGGRYGHGHGQFYSSSPLSNPPVQLEPQHHHSGTAASACASIGVGVTQLPPLSYVDRLASPLHHSQQLLHHHHPAAGPGSPHSPLATAPPASFERERVKDCPGGAAGNGSGGSGGSGRELPIPLGVGQGGARRGILTHP